MQNNISFFYTLKLLLLFCYCPLFILWVLHHFQSQVNCQRNCKWKMCHIFNSMTCQFYLELRYMHYIDKALTEFKEQVASYHISYTNHLNETLRTGVTLTSQLRLETFLHPGSTDKFNLCHPGTEDLKSPWNCKTGLAFRFPISLL
jgi:hypothetical protein